MNVKLRFTVVILLLGATCCRAQEPAAKVHQDWFFVGVAAAAHGAAGWDVEQTIRTRRFFRVRYGPQAEFEGNALARPFAHLPVPLYRASAQAGVLGVDFAAYRLRHSRRRWARAIWWAPYAATITLNIRGGLSQKAARRWLK